MLLEPGQMDHRQVRCHPRGLDRIDAAELRRPPAKKPRPAQRYRLTDRFTAEELDQLVTRYKAGETSTALAREGGIAKSTFLRLLAERGVGTRPRGLTPSKEGEILRPASRE
ncbi:hypothetical protein D3C85_1393960 [compost metagenome]